MLHWLHLYAWRAFCNAWTGDRSLQSCIQNHPNLDLRLRDTNGNLSRWTLLNQIKGPYCFLNTLTIIRWWPIKTLQVLFINECFKKSFFPVSCFCRRWILSLSRSLRRKTFTMNYYVGLQANQLIKQLINLSNSAAISNPYLLTAAVSLKSISEYAARKHRLTYTDIQTNSLCNHESKIHELFFRYGMKKFILASGVQGVDRWEYKVNKTFTNSVTVSFSSTVLSKRDYKQYKSEGMERSDACLSWAIIFCWNWSYFLLYDLSYKTKWRSLWEYIKYFQSNLMLLLSRQPILKWREDFTSQCPLRYFLCEILIYEKHKAPFLFIFCHWQQLFFHHVTIKMYE